MGVLSDFFIADASPVPEYDGGHAFVAADKCQCKGITPLECATFLVVLRGQELTVDNVGMMSEFKLLTPEDAENWTMSVPQDFVNALAKLQPNEIPALADKFAEATAEELGPLGWSTDDFVSFIRDLSRLSRRAIEKRKAMFLWNSV